MITRITFEYWHANDGWLPDVMLGSDRHFALYRIEVRDRDVNRRFRLEHADGTVEEKS